MINSSPNEGLEICSFEVFPGRIWGIKSLLIQWAVWFPLSPGSQGWLDALLGLLNLFIIVWCPRKRLAQSTFLTCVYSTLPYITFSKTSHHIPSHHIHIYIYVLYSLFPEVGPFAHPGPSPGFSLPLPEDTDRTRELKLAAETEASGVAWAQANPVDMGLGRHGRIRKVRWKKMC